MGTQESISRDRVSFYKPESCKYGRAVLKCPGPCSLGAKVAAGWHGNPVTELCGKLEN